METTFIVEPEQVGERIDAYLARLQPEHSRAYWQRQCKLEQVQISGKPIKPSYKLAEGDMISITTALPADFSKDTLPIIYEDADIIVINKPVGVLTHAKGEEIDEFTIAEYMRTRTTDNPEGNRPGIVHRLDRDTSGVIVAAKTNEAKRFLQKQFSTRKAKKTYIALVEGAPKEPKATLKLPIERNPKKPQTFRVGPNGKPSETTYEVAKQYKKYSLLWLRPTTGRTHQLRVHLKHIGCPIVGDRLYGKELAHLGRLFLHAETLEITLPTTRERKIFTAKMPPELLNFLKTLPE